VVGHTKLRKATVESVLSTLRRAGIAIIACLSRAKMARGGERWHAALIAPLIRLLKSGASKAGHRQECGMVLGNRKTLL
jgi:hypothetical protein